MSHDIELKMWADNGWIVVPNVLDSSVVSEARAEIDNLFDDPRLTQPGNGRSRVRATIDGNTIVDRLDPVCDLSPVLDRVARSAPVIDEVAQVIGPRPSLFKDKVITKPPGTAGYDLHQDFMRWQTFGVPADEMATAAVCLDRATRESGAVEMFTGQHHRLLTPPGVAADPLEEDVDHARKQIVELDPGDVLLLHPLIPHQSAPNRSDEPRRMLFFTYNSARHGNLYDTYYERHETIFGDALGSQVAPMPRGGAGGPETTPPG